MQHIFLIGLRGSGKSTVGKLLAAHLHRPFHDTDQTIAAEQGSTVAEIFKTRGEPAFRHLETAALEELCRTPDRAVIATGGGIVLNPHNRELMRKHGLVFHLNAPPEVLYHRIRQDPDSDGLRPSLTGMTGLDDMRATSDKRVLLYQSARHYEVTVENRTPQEVVEAVVALLPQTDE